MCFYFIVGWDIDELENEWSSSDDPATTGKEISANDVFEDRGLARGLRTYNDLGGGVSAVWLKTKRGSYNLREIQAVIADGVEDQILQLIDYSQQIFPESCHGVEVEVWQSWEREELRLVVRCFASTSSRRTLRKKERLARQGSSEEVSRGVQVRYFVL